jgi:hypothetical protein
MTGDELETLLRAWGRVYGERPPVDVEERDAPATHPLARGMEFAPGKKSAVIRQRTHMDRAGFDRRRMMAAAVKDGCPSLRRMQIVPMGFVDPVPSRETRSYRMEARDWPVPPELQRVQRAALDLHGIDTLKGLVLRVHYCTRHPNIDDKAADVTLRFRSPVGTRVYREALAGAKGWMQCELARAAA